MRTSYAITGSGRAELKDWLRELVAVPEPECSRFEAALSVLDVLARREVTALLTERVQALDKDLAVWRATLAQTRETVARIFLIEAEYAVAMREAEAVWLRSLLTQLGSPDAF